MHDVDNGGWKEGGLNGRGGGMDWGKNEEEGGRAGSSRQHVTTEGAGVLSTGGKQTTAAKVPVMSVYQSLLYTQHHCLSVCLSVPNTHNTTDHFPHWVSLDWGDVLLMYHYFLRLKKYYVKWHLKCIASIKHFNVMRNFKCHAKLPTLTLFSSILSHYYSWVFAVIATVIRLTTMATTACFYLSGY